MEANGLRKEERHMMKKIVSLFCALAMAATMLTGCGQPAAETPEAPEQEQTATTEPETVEASLKAVGLGDSSRQPVRELSGGQKRRGAILRALLAEYDLLLLDEPFRGLDAATKQVVLADTLTRCTGRTVLLVTHDSEELDAMGVVNRLSL